MHVKASGSECRIGGNARVGGPPDGGGAPEDAGLAEGVHDMYQRYEQGFSRTRLDCQDLVR